MTGITERRKKVLAELMKDTVYDAVVAVLGEHGFSGLTMERVAKQAGVATGSLYNYFPNKNALLQFVHKRTIDPILQQGQEIVDSEAPALRKLEMLIRVWFEYSHAHRSVYQFFIMDDALRGVLKSQGQETHTFAVQQVTTVITQGVDEGAFRPVNAVRVAGFILGAVHRTREQQFQSDEPWSTDELTEDLIGVFVHGMAAPE